ncbi:uncharacterized protein [Physcomitrium patens]|uniref:Uncharacterized protein n=1 Tax=Physcomitrium patens TaxID=3218 RepID=A0A7I4EQQ4_PHYPA|nr:uncharacterized protein LOC112287111 isoform X1 [Physcomitrium patens]|eukprot:XP_024385578.1 uncharacterized protein LOC112287111 isoform X1 [Physcomitrella patens]
MCVLLLQESECAMELNCQRTMEARERPNSKLEVKKALAGTTTTLFGSQPRTRGFGGVIRLAGVVRSWPSSTVEVLHFIGRGVALNYTGTCGVFYYTEARKLGRLKDRFEQKFEFLKIRKREKTLKAFRIN